MKIALCLIAKDNKEEAELLDRCLTSCAEYFDGIFITAASKEFTGEIKKITEKYNGVYSEFEWVNDFSKARNFNFAQVPDEYDYIMWSDTDDVWRGLEKLRPTLEESKSDAYATWYLYDFDESNQPVVVHKKTMIVKNDSSFEWKGQIHEDLNHKRNVAVKFIEGIERLHLSNAERQEESRVRNLEISEEHFDPSDPRSFWNLGNSLMGVGDYEKAYDIYLEFLHKSESDDEKYLVLIALGQICKHLGKKDEAVANMRMAIGSKPSYPDAYLTLGQMYFEWGDLDQAETHVLQGLLKEPSYHAMIVYNPRDYDYNPMLLLTRIYFEKSRPDLAIAPLEACLKINPNNPELQNVLKLLKEDVEQMKQVLSLIKDVSDETSKEEVGEILEKVPVKLQNHPAICNLRNKYFIKDSSTGKDVAIFCGPTTFEWNPELFEKKGFGGSEEAIIHLSKNLAKKGMNVTVYNNCGPDSIEHEGVKWEPFWKFNSRDKWDTLILWRSPRMADYELNADKIFIDLHDVIPDAEFTRHRLEKITKVFVKSDFHKTLFPSIPEDKFVVVPNGLNTAEFEETENDPNLIINTSSPERSLDALVKVFARVKKERPDAKLHWAYGWGLFDEYNKNNAEVSRWVKRTKKRMNELGIEQLGKIPQKDANKMYQKASILLYPTEFAEIDCISVRKAQLGGCMPITTDFAALETTNKHGIKIHSDKDKDNWTKPNQFQFGVEKQSQIKKFAEEVIRELDKQSDRAEMVKWAKGFDWEQISDIWYNEIIWKK